MGLDERVCTIYICVCMKREMMRDESHKQLEVFATFPTIYRVLENFEHAEADADDDAQHNQQES